MLDIIIAAIVLSIFMLSFYTGKINGFQKYGKHDADLILEVISPLLDIVNQYR